MNKKLLILLTITSLNLLAYSDYDMDGVDDKIDQCPNTLFSELVGPNGCTIKTLELKGEQHFDIIYGVNLSQANYTTTKKTDTITQSLQVDYYDKDFSVQVSTSYYTSDDDSGTNDSYVGAYYRLFPMDKLTLRLGAGIILPTYKSELDNNNLDLTSSINASYMLENSNIFAGYSYTLVNDDDVAGIASYQNTSSFSMGIGFYPEKDFYVSGSYNSSESIYQGTDDIDTLSLYGFYNINISWFTSFSYEYGLSDSASDNSVTLRLGYYF
ncbi:MAG: DUF3187 domain-containing protein [Sulfurimonas sp.]|uniref:DUF3187 domain-containing protein n=1 Tax=Sulfurimonas sp. TaxID=2022749 RepID=UPI00260EFE07|nr:DUF3187 domain-containing protein [Sulfurimonas sp.]MCW8895606.1 DUF3187 domain-containing protein [Sulfurimonas sp.]MCW8954777.1 DUF3187 domain-containing protein [Sulfurimonas sp.]MCW9067156.1 DUF3187 domain-containing protein [Sulfurimonas sp.]